MTGQRYALRDGAKIGQCMLDGVKWVQDSTVRGSLARPTRLVALGCVSFLIHYSGIVHCEHNTAMFPMVMTKVNYRLPFPPHLV